LPSSRKRNDQPTLICAPIGGPSCSARSDRDNIWQRRERSVFVIGDLATVWLAAYVQDHAPSEHRPAVYFTVLAYPDRTFPATISYVAAALDLGQPPGWCAAVDNAGLLWPQMFASVRIRPAKAPRDRGPARCHHLRGRCGLRLVARDDDGIGCAIRWATNGAGGGAGRSRAERSRSPRAASSSLTWRAHARRKLFADKPTDDHRADARRHGGVAVHPSRRSQPVIVNLPITRGSLVMSIITVITGTATCR
jgi:hypothetical protein